MPEDAVRQAIADEEHLKLLFLGFLVSAGVTAAFSLFGLLYVFMGIFMNVAFSRLPPSASHSNAAPPAFIGWIIALIGLGFLLLGMTVALLKVRTAFCIKRRKSRIFCMVIAGISCLEIPYGTLLGVLSFMVLGRESVAALFASAQALSGRLNSSGHAGPG